MEGTYCGPSVSIYLQSLIYLPDDQQSMAQQLLVNKYSYNLYVFRSLFHSAECAMRRILFYLMLCWTLAEPVEAQMPVWGVFHSIHTTISDGAESIVQRTDNLRMY